MSDQPSNNEANTDTSINADSGTSEYDVRPTSNPVPLDTPPEQVSESPKAKSLRWLWILLAAIVVACLAVAGYLATRPEPVAKTAVDTPAVRIGLSLDTYRESRWEKDQQYIEARVKERGAKLTSLSAEGDAKLQNEHIENLISQQVDVLMIVPNDAEAMTPVIAKAKDAGIKVLSYDRMILNSDIDAYVSFDNEQVGKNSAQYVVDALAAKKGAKIAYVGGAPTDNNSTLIKKGAMGVLNPLIASGAIKLVYDVPTTNWKPDAAYANLKAYLDKGNTIDGIVAANDGTAFGAIRALQETGKTGVPTAGQDAELTAVHRLIAGTQLMTNYKPIKLLANYAVDIAIDMAEEKKPKQNTTLPNGFKDVPSYFLMPVPVTKANIDETVIKDGFYTRAEVYGK